jgi:hypothetical protein
VSAAGNASLLNAMVDAIVMANLLGLEQRRKTARPKRAGGQAQLIDKQLNSLLNTGLE